MVDSPIVSTIFGVPWSELTLDVVRGYLEVADAEPLTWEAKGTRLDPNEVRRQICAFANGHEVGYLILGAREAGSDAEHRWAVEGLPFPGEPLTWISNVVSDPAAGVRPRPDFDVQSWPAPDGHVAVVRIVPTPTPPCLANGTVYERLPGKSQQVRDLIVLAQLYSRGDAARREARQRADRAATIVSEDLLGGDAGVFRKEPVFLGDPDEEVGRDDSRHIRFAVSAAATGNVPNISARLFRDEVVEDVWTELRDRPRPGLPPGWGGTPDVVAWSQDALTWRQQVEGIVNGVTIVRGAWDGSVAVGQRLSTEDVYPDSLAMNRIAEEWRFAERFVIDRLGGFGDFYVTILVSGGRFPRRSGTDPIIMRRGPVLPGVGDDLIGSVSRELMRAVGNPGPEPK